MSLRSNRSTRFANHGAFPKRFANFGNERKTAGKPSHASQAWHALKFAKIVGHHGKLVLQSGGRDEDIHRPDGTPRRLEGVPEGRGMGRGVSGKGKDPQVLEQEVHFTALLFLPSRRASLHAVEQLIMGDRRDGEVARAVLPDVAHGGCVPSQKVDARIRVEEMGHR